MRRMGRRPCYNGSRAGWSCEKLRICIGVASGRVTRATGPRVRGSHACGATTGVSVPQGRGSPEELRQLAEHVLDAQPLLHVLAAKKSGPPFAVEVTGLEAQTVRKMVVAGAGVGGRTPGAPLGPGHRPRLVAQPAVVVREELPHLLT